MARPGPGSRANAHRAITAASGKVEHLVHQSPTTQTRIIILPPLVRGEVSARRPSRWSPRDGDSTFEGQMAHAAERATQVEVRTQQPGTCRAAATRSDRARPGGPSHGLHLRPRPGVLDGLRRAAATQHFCCILAFCGGFVVSDLCGSVCACGGRASSSRHPIGRRGVVRISGIHG